MSDLRRRFVRLSIFLLPAFLLLAALHLFRGDLRDAASNYMRSGYTFHGNFFLMRGHQRAEALGVWTRDAIREILKRDRIYRFKEPKSGFRIEIRSEAGTSECEPGSNLIVICGIAENAPMATVQRDLSRLIARAMLREGSPEAAFSPWFEEGVSRFYEGTQPPYGSRKDDLIADAARNQSFTLAKALEADRGADFDAISHSITAFLHDAFAAEVIARYADIEREPGPVPRGEFERIFGQDVEKEWRDFLERRHKGS
jgi:hypothetical protein